jgi:hypothetical protein
VILDALVRLAQPPLLEESFDGDRGDETSHAVASVAHRRVAATPQNRALGARFTSIASAAELPEGWRRVPK